MIKNMLGEGTLVIKCKETIEHLSLHSDIITILRCYSGSPTLIDQFRLNYTGIKFYRANRRFRFKRIFSEH